MTQYQITGFIYARKIEYIGRLKNGRKFNHWQKLIPLRVGQRLLKKQTKNRGRVLNFQIKINQNQNNMEKYKYTFRNKWRVIEVVEATSLTEAMTKIGVSQYVARYEFPFMAVIGPVKNQFIALGVTWEPVK